MSLRIEADETPRHVRTAGSREDADVRQGILAAIPRLRAFAMSLIGTRDGADDLVQETLVRALDKLGSFQPGTNLEAWLFTILRNQFVTQYRRRRREVPDPEGQIAARLAAPATQDAGLQMDAFRAALDRLSPDQREILLLVGAEGFSYEEVAHICGIALGTAKSRLHRARARLAVLLNLTDVDGDLGLDGTSKAAMQDITFTQGASHADF